MSAVASPIETAIKRCAVCKIDLKGRFVYVDDCVEVLLEQSMEQLFGKSIYSFLDEAGQEIIKRYLGKSNRYETSFDNCQVCLVAASGRNLPATIIISMTFAAGSPANYQLLINADPDKTATNEPVNAPEEFLAQLSEPASPDRLNELVWAAAQYIGEPRTACYSIHGKKLRLLEGVSNPALATVSAPGKLHRVAVKRNREYAYDHDKSVQWSIEVAGEAPHELIIPLGGHTRPTHLLRVIFDDQLPEPEAREMIARARIAGDLIKRWLRPNREELVSVTDTQKAPSDTGFEVYSRLGLAALIADHHGRITMINPRLREFVPDDIDGLSLSGLLFDTLRIDSSSESKTLEIFLSLPESSGEPAGIEAVATLPDGRRALINVRRAATGPEKSETTVVVLPLPATDDGQIASRIALLVRSLFDRAISLAEVASDFAAKLGHERTGRHNSDQHFTLLCLMDCLGKVAHCLADSKALVDLCVQPVRLTQVNLNLHTDQLRSELKRLVPNINISLEHDSLPETVTCPKTLAAVWQLLLTQILREWPNDSFRARLEAGSSEGRLLLELRLPPNTPVQAMKHLPFADKTDADGDALTLAVDHLLARIGGSSLVKLDPPSICLSLPGIIGPIASEQ